MTQIRSKDHDLLHRIETEEMMTAEAQTVFYNQNSKNGYLVLCDDRETPIHSSFQFPKRWECCKSLMHFSGIAAKGEYYCFQLAVFSSETDIQDIKFEYEGFPLEVTCFNSGGIGSDSKPFASIVTARKNRVQPLWFGMQIPENYHGEVNGSIRLIPKNAAAAQVEINISVTDEVLRNAGDSEPWRHSRLRWLNSAIAHDDDITHPFTPIRVKGNTLRTLGHKVTLNEWGLPARIESFFSKTVETLTLKPTDILGGEFAFEVKGLVAKLAVPIAFTKKNNGKVTWQSEITYGDSIAVTLNGELEYDGYMAFDAVVKAVKDTTIADISLNIPYAKQSAKYWMGMGEIGGLRKNNLDWKWDITLNQDTMWLGEVNAGMMVRLKDEAYVKPAMLVYYHYIPLKEPKSWANGGAGGCTVVENANDVTLTAYSGERTLKAGEALHYIFDLSLTPIKPLNKIEHYVDHYYQMVPNNMHSVFESMSEVSKLGANIINIHHATDHNQYVNFPFLEDEKVRDFVGKAHENSLKAKLYLTVKEISVHQSEFWAIKSLGQEIIVNAWERGNSFQGLEASPDPWLQKANAWLDKYVGDEYMTAWRTDMPFLYHVKHESDAMEASVVTASTSRFNNYFLEGTQYLLENTGMDGLYFDDVAFDRNIMKRCRKVLDRHHPGCSMDLHTWNYYKNNNMDNSRLAGWGNSMNLYIDNMAFVDRLWVGEGFDYNVAPDNWLIEISGIPFGMMGEMLQHGGNVWRGMLFGMTCRALSPTQPEKMWDLWNDFRIWNATMYGFWHENCPVKTDAENVKATVYRQAHTIMVAIASWANEDKDIELAFDWGMLGWEKGSVTGHVPQVEGFQEAEAYKIGDKINIPAGKGKILILKI